MKVVVIGSGLIGLTSAYYLRERGLDVTVIEREDGPGRAASFANGALLTASMSEPWNTPGSWRAIIASLGRSDAPVQLRMRTLPQLRRWGPLFLRNSNAGLFERNALNNFLLAKASLDAMEALRQRTGIEYDRAANGALKLFGTVESFDRALKGAQLRAAHGLIYTPMSAAQMAELEPALAPIAGGAAGAIHYHNDEVGDAYAFSVALTEYLKKVGVSFRFGMSVSSLRADRGRAIAVETDGGPIVADRYVVAAGPYSLPLLETCGVSLPVQPVKGYSVTFNAYRAPGSLRIPVIDDRLHAAIVPLGNNIRVAGTAEFAGFDLQLQRPRVDNLVSLLREVLPASSFDSSTAQPWCGLRATSADGVPIIGTTPLTNLLVNTGHGHLGWTMAAGAGELLANILSNEPSRLDPALFSLQRFA